MCPSIRSGWQGADQAIEISETVLPNESAGRFYVEERKPFVRLLTAWDGDRVLGYLLVEFDDRTEYLREIGVRPDCQGQGIGRALVHAFAVATAMSEVWSRPLPHRRELFLRWGFTREDAGDLWGVSSEVARKTAPKELDGSP